MEDSIYCPSFVVDKFFVESRIEQIGPLSYDIPPNDKCLSLLACRCHGGGDGGGVVERS
jgi:hypothetical protein